MDRPRQRDTVDFFSIIAWEGSAEYVARAGKGDMCIVNGVLCTRRYTDKQGVQSEVVEIKADELTIVRKNTDTKTTTIDESLLEESDESVLPL